MICDVCGRVCSIIKMEMNFVKVFDRSSDLTINANGYCHRLNSWIDSCNYCAYFSEKHSPDDSNYKLRKGDE